MNEGLRKLLRTAQIHVPWAAEAKYELQRAFRHVLRRPFEEDFRAVRLLDLGDAPLVLDIGANRGQSIDALRLMRPGVRIISFEPNPLLAERLRRRYRSTAAVEIRPYGLADGPAELLLHVPYYNGYVFDGLASFDERAAATWLEARILGYDARRLRIERHTCPVRPLDGLGLAPALMKIDVQGYEHRVLLGARETLRRSLPVLVLEAPDEDCLRSLAELGYRPHAFRHGHLIPDQLGSLNTFFLAPGGPGVTAPG